MKDVISKRHRLKRAALVCAAFGLFVLIGSLAGLIAKPAFTKGNHRVDGAHDSTRLPSSDVADTDPAYRLANSDSLPSPGRPELLHNGQADKSPPSEGAQSTEHAVVHIRFITNAGQPEVVTVDCTITSQPPGRARAAVVDQFARATDRNGELKLESLRDHRATLRVNSESWYADETEVAVSSTEAVVVILSPALTVRIRALYDDGLPVTYMGSLRRVDAKRQWAFGFNADGLAAVPRVATDCPLRCKVFSQKRPGYLSHTVEFTAAELSSGSELLVTVPKSTKPFGAIRLEFEGGPVAFSGDVQLEGRAMGPTTYPFDAGQSSVEIWPLPAGDEFRASVLGEMAWRSGWVVVNAGDLIVLKARLARSGAVRVRLVGQDAKPFEGGSLRLSNGDYLHYRSGSPPVAAALRSDADGVVVLAGLPEGRLSVEMEAWGKEPVSREVDVGAGATVDLGDIVLVDAIGEITVQLAGVREGVRYSIFLGRPGNGGSIYPYVPILGTRQTLTNLPLRGWVVSVSLAKGGDVVSQEVALTLRQPSTLVTLDVSSIEP